MIDGRWPLLVVEKVPTTGLFLCPGTPLGLTMRRSTATEFSLDMYGTIQRVTLALPRWWAGTIVDSEIVEVVVVVLRGFSCCQLTR